MTNDVGFKKFETLVPGNIRQEENIDKRLLLQRKQRNFRQETWFSWITFGLTCFIAFCALILIVCFLIHFIIPEQNKWIAPSDLQRLGSFSTTVISGVCASIAITYFFKK